MKTATTSADPLLEIRRYRDEQAAKFNYDLDAMWADARSRQGQDGHKVVNLHGRRKRPLVELREDVPPSRGEGC